MKRPARFSVRSDRGSSIIEFSLITVTFVFLLLGVVEMGRLILVYTTLANAVRAGARYAIVHGADRTGSGATGPSGPGSTTQVETVVKNIARAGLLNTSQLNVSVTYPNGTNSAGSPVSVSATYTYDPMLQYFSSVLSPTVGSTSEGVITF